MRIERILANNPGPFTGPGTNTWLLADERRRAIVIDPGPIDESHARQILEKAAGCTVTGILVTHTHPDHAPLANPLGRDLGVPCLGYGPGPHFEPDEVVREGSGIPVGSLALEVLHTPGHSSDHLCFRVEDVLFSGDHIIGGSSVMVEDLGPYLASLERLAGTGLRRLYPGHGEQIDRPDEMIDWYIAHRRQRHEEIMKAITAGADTKEMIVETVYADVDRSLHPLAAMSVEAHLVLLRDEGRIAFEGERIVSRPPQP